MPEDRIKLMDYESNSVCVLGKKHTQMYAATKADDNSTLSRFIRNY
jgi:hypothetical protein